MKKYQAHWIMFWLTGLLVLCAVFCIGQWSSMFIYLILAGISGVINYVRYISCYITIDGNMVEGHYGLIKTVKFDANRTNITSVVVNQGILGKLLGYGTVVISTASEKHGIKFLKNPEQIKKDILDF